MLVLGKVRVLDLSRRYPGSYTAMILGDFGADVIKVDPPLDLFPIAGEMDNSEETAAFYAPDRNKRSIVLNLQHESGREVFHRLAKTADVIIEGFRPGVMKRLGCDYESLKKLNPKLVYCALTGFGPDGPYASLPAHDMNFCSIGGALSLIGPKDGPPYFASNLLGDLAGAGLHGVIGVLLALIARENTGKGQFVDIAYLDGVLSLLSSEASHYFQTGEVPRRGRTAFTGGQPWAQAFKCKDGEYISIACGEPKFWANLCRALGREDLIPFHRVVNEKCDWVVAILAAAFLTHTRNEWFELLKDKDICVAPVNYLNETFVDPQVIHRNMVLELDHPNVGKVRQVGIPIKLSETPGHVSMLGSPVGTHTEAVLTELGYSLDQVNVLRASGAIS